jgi:hypothetical protein
VCRFKDQTIGLFMGYRQHVTGDLSSKMTMYKMENTGILSGIGENKGLILTYIAYQNPQILRALNCLLFCEE